MIKPIDKALLHYIIGYFDEKGFKESKDMLGKFLDQQTEVALSVKKPVTLPDSDSDNESDSGHSTVGTTSTTSSPSRSRLSSSNSNSQLEIICDKEAISYLSNDFASICTKSCCNSGYQTLSSPKTKSNSRKSIKLQKKRPTKSLQIKSEDNKRDEKSELDMTTGLKTALTVLANRANIGLTTTTEKIIDVFVSHLGFRPNKLFIKDLVSASNGVLELRKHLRTKEDLIQFKHKSNLQRMTLTELADIINILQRDFKPNAANILRWKKNIETSRGQNEQTKDDFISTFIQNRNNELLEENHRYNSLLAGITDEQASAEFLSKVTCKISISCKKKMMARRQFNNEKLAIQSRKKLSLDGILTKTDNFIFHFLMNQSSNFICSKYILNKINFNRPSQLYFRLNDLKMAFDRFHRNGLKGLQMKNDQFGSYIEISDRIELYNVFYKLKDMQNKSKS